MNIAQAKAIPLTEILKQLNIEPVKENEKEAWYLSPWRHELRASFHVNKQNNVCFDFGDWIGGDVVKFIQLLLKSNGDDYSVSNALRWLGQMKLVPAAFKPTNLVKEKKPIWQIDRVEPIKDFGLKRYLEQRGISLSIARKHLSEVTVRHYVTNERIWALGFKNNDDGYELRNPEFKSCVAPKTITFIRGTDRETSQIHVFEGVMDYLTYLTKRESYKHDHDVAVLNSVGLAVHLEDYIKNSRYKQAFTWLDNDKAGGNHNAGVDHCI